MAGGYMGKVLVIDLSESKAEIREIPERIYRDYLGGNGLAVRLLYDETKPGADPLGPENVLVFATGPSTGTVMPSSAITCGVTKSPLTGLFMDSYAGGVWGPELKYAGYDALVIKGAASSPKYLWIDNQKVEIRPADHLWGLNALDVQIKIKQELGDEEVQIATIGKAGENLVRYASIIAETRAFGRGGLGAVLGAKKLKAIAIRGTQAVKVPNATELISYTLACNQKLLRNPATAKGFPTYGSTASPATYSAMGILGTRNWQQESFEEAEKISGEYNAKRNLLVRSRACSACIIRSSKIWKTSGRDCPEVYSEGPEYETLFSFGSMCGNSSFESIIIADRLCDEYGMDTITAGCTIAFAMECFEKGLINKTDTGGLELTWGNSEAIIALLHQIANRQGFGNVLAEGTRKAAQIIGRGAEAFAIHTKGLEFAGHSARAHKGQAVGYATSNRGGSHQDTRVVPERSGMFDRKAVIGKGKLAKESQDMDTIGDSLIMCRRATEALYGFFLNEEILKAVNIVTGHNYSLQELCEVAERIYTLERMFNVREGARRADDTLPERFLKEPIPEGGCKGSLVTPEELETMLDEYYQLRQWDVATGVPTKELLARLSLDDCINDLP